MTDDVKITEVTFLDNKEMREQYLSRLDVLDKVKTLLIIPELECMTLKQIADYYEVSVETVRSQYKSNRDEFESDGATIKNPRYFKEFLNGCKSTIKNVQQMNGKLVIGFNDNTTLIVPNRGIMVFPKRSILRMGMLLRDSPIAKEIRTQLLNIVENAEKESPELLTQEIETEESLLFDIGKAFSTGNIMKFAEATQKYSMYQKRHIVTLEQDKKMLTAEILDLSDRSMMNAVMRKLAGTLQMSFSMAYGILYKQLLYRYGINVKARDERDKSYIKHIRENEWDKVQKCIAAILEENGINSSKFFESCKPIAILR